MKRDQHLLSRPAFHAFLFCLGVALLHWPFLFWPQGWRQPHAYVYLFVIWALLVAGLWLVSRSLGPHLPKTRERQDKDWE